MPGAQGCGGARALSEAAQAHPDKRLELWFEDEARVANKRRVCHRWFLESRRATAICDRRYEWAYIYSAVRPATGQDFTLVLPEVSARATDLFLGKFAESLLADDITLVPLPPYSPEPNPEERIWLRYFSHRLLDDYDAIYEACCLAWRDLTKTKTPIQCLTSYPWITQVVS